MRTLGLKGLKLAIVFSENSHNILTSSPQFEQKTLTYNIEHKAFNVVQQNKETEFKKKTHKTGYNIKYHTRFLVDNHMNIASY